jgi:adenine-specific DNA-methyltransferase
MCTDPGDLVLDPTCGSGTTAHVAEQWGRRWITIDTSRVALALARQRLMGAKFPYYLLADSAEGRLKEGQGHRHGAARQPALRRHPPRVRLRAGAAHHAEVHRQQPRHRRGHEPAPDRCCHQAPRRLRAALRQAVREQQQGAGDRSVHGREPVAPPVARVRRWPRRGRREARCRAGGRRRRTGADFTQSILDNLAKAGIQNGQRQERIELESIEPYAGEWINAVGIRKAPTSAAPKPPTQRPTPTPTPQKATVSQPTAIKTAPRRRQPRSAFRWARSTARSAPGG